MGAPPNGRRLLPSVRDAESQLKPHQVTHQVILFPNPAVWCTLPATRKSKAEIAVERGRTMEGLLQPTHLIFIFVALVASVALSIIPIVLVYMDYERTPPQFRK